MSNTCVNAKSVDFTKQVVFYRFETRLEGIVSFLGAAFVEHKAVSFLASLDAGTASTFPRFCIPMKSCELIVGLPEFLLEFSDFCQRGFFGALDFPLFEPCCTSIFFPPFTLFTRMTVWDDRNNF